MALRNIRIVNAGVGISIPAGLDPEIENATIENSNIGVQYRDAPPGGTFTAPDAELVRILREFQAAHPNTTEEAIVQLEKSGAAKWANGAKHLAEFGGWLVQNWDKVAAMVKGAEDLLKK